MKHPHRFKKVVSYDGDDTGELIVVLLIHFFIMLFSYSLLFSVTNNEEFSWLFGYAISFLVLIIFSRLLSRTVRYEVVA